MVVNIVNATPSVGGSLGYNDDKVERGVAQMIAAFNVIGTSKEDIARTFTTYEARNRRTKDTSFHMNIDPLKGQDNMSDDDIVRFAGRIMEDLGYGKQPFVVYRHDDIGRVHYHVVSIRTDENGRKIPDFQELKRCNRIINRLQSEFDYRVGNEKKSKKVRPAMTFNPKDGDVTAQIRAIFNYCLKYNFTSVEQFRMILRSAHVGLDVPSVKTDSFVLQGLDSRMRPCTKPITEKHAGTAFYADYQVRAMECVELMGVMMRERARICGCARGPLKDATSESHFRNMMQKNGISVRFERSPETGKITGGNFVDHVSRCAFRLSELGNDLSLDKVLEAADKWPHDDKSSEKQPKPQQSHSSSHGPGLLSGLLSGGGGASKGHDEKDETDLEKQERLKQKKL